MIIETLFYLREYLFPSGCGGCGEALLNGEDAYFGLCGNCRAVFESAFAGESRCEICGKPLISEKEACLSCRKNGALESGRYNERLIKLRTCFPYTGKFRLSLGAYKFGKSLGAGNFLAGFFLPAIEGLGLAPNGETAWVPVPPRPGKIKKKGWDQIEYLAKLLGRNHRREASHRRSGGSGPRYSFPVCRCLKRLPSRSQKELNREERGTNLKGRILCKKQPPRTAILFDDVMTTGATLDACAAALLEGGAEKVYGVCLFFD